MSTINNALPAGTILRSSSKKYRILSVLGQGSFGITYRAEFSTLVGNIPVDVTVAVKEFFMPSICVREKDGTVSVNSLQTSKFNQCKSDFLKEAEALRTMPVCDGIVKVNETFQTNSTCYYVMEYLGDLCLKDRVAKEGGMQEDAAISMFVKLVRAVSFLHGQHRLHLDIKPRNIMLKDGDSPKLIDFGQSVRFSKNGKPMRQVAAGCSDGYAAPEQYKGISFFSPQTDIYALGCVLYFMLTGKNLPKAEEVTPQLLSETLPESITTATREIINTCLQKQMHNRYANAALLLSQLPGSQLADDESDTMLIADIPTKRWQYSRKAIGGIIGIAMALVIITIVTLAWRRCTGGKPAEQVLEINDSTTLRDSTAYNKTDTFSAGNEPAQVAGQQEGTPKPDRQTQGVDGMPEAVPSKPHNDDRKSQRPYNASESSDRHDLGWAIWEGKVDGEGMPTGFGTVTVKRTKALRDGLTVNPGDVIRNCEFYGASVYQGELYRKGGAAPEIITP